MRRAALAVAVVALVGTVAAAPKLAAYRAPAYGVTIDAAGWCPTGVCLHGVAYAARGLTVAKVAVNWDRSVRLVDASVRAPTRGGGEAHAAEALPGWIGPVTVEGLTVEGAPLPVLSGTLWPERHLTGPGVTIDGSVAEADLSTAYGDVHVRAEPQSTGGYRIAASCPALTVPADVLGEPFTLRDVAATGVWSGLTWTGQAELGALRLPVVVTRNEHGGTAHIVVEHVPIADLYGALAERVPEASRAHILGTATVHDLSLTLRDGQVHLDLHGPELTGLRVDGLVSDDIHQRFTYATLDAVGDPAPRTTGPAEPGWTPLAALGPMLPAAVIAAEDAGFHAHPGYDLQSMVDAAADNAARGSVHRGGSTITQQLAKNLYLDGTRTYVRKLRELLYAVNLEGTLGKRGVLETYLNVVEFGPGLYGAAAAADRYFLKAPAGLLPEEAAWLASILPSPRTAWDKQYMVERPNLGRVHTILDNMVTLGAEDRAAAKARGVHFVR